MNMLVNVGRYQPPRYQILVALLAVITVPAMGSWSGVGHFFTTVTALAVTGVLAVLALAMGLGGLTTLRRVTI